MRMKAQKEGLKYSIIVVTYNGITDIAKCVESLYKHTDNFELIVVDNHSTDGTVGYLTEIASQKDNIKLILNDENRNFGPANNQGAEIAEGKYLVFLNSDTVVTPMWAEKLALCIEDDEKTAMVGPVSNSSNGRQGIGTVDVNNLDQSAVTWSNMQGKKYLDTGILYGWCIMAKRQFLLDEPFVFDPIFTNSYEDNDLCVRAQRKGWRMTIDYGTFIYHKGQSTFKREWKTPNNFAKNYVENGKKNQELFFNKWKPKEKQKLIAVYRIANCEQYIKASMDQTSKFADEIICLFARSKDKTKDIALSYKKVVAWEEWHEEDHPFDEQAERNWLLQKAIERGADWIISIDGDEVYEDKFVENVREYMQNPNPHTLAYWCNWRTVWDVINGQEMFRTDGIFGGFQNYRFFKVIPGLEIKTNDNIYNHHCGSAPVFPAENLDWLNVRVKHLGYDSPEQRKRKYEFYRKNDPHPLVKDVGNADYHHLIDTKVTLKPYREKNRLSLMTIVKNEENLIFQMLENVRKVVDEIVVIDNMSTDGTISEVERFARIYNRKVKIVQKEFEHDENGMLLNYSEAKNFGKSQCSGEWILNMDADEMFEPKEVTNLFSFLDEETDGFLFSVINYLEPPKSPDPKDAVFSVSETIRLYRNIDELFYAGLVHESLEDAVTVRAINKKGFIIHSPIKLHHRGYLKPKEKVREKVDRYDLINQRQFEVSGGQDPRPLFNRALHMFNEGKIEEGVKLYKESLALNPAFWRSKQNLGYYHLQCAKELLNDSLKELPQMFRENNKMNELVNTLNKFEFRIKKVA